MRIAVVPFAQQLTQFQYRRGPWPERSLRQDVNCGQQRQLAARPAPARPAERAPTQLILQSKHVQPVADQLPVSVRPCASARVGPVPGAADHRGA